MIMCLQDIMSQLPPLLERLVDDGHRCHIWLDPSTHVNPLMTHKYRDRNSFRGKYYPNLLIWHKGSQRIYVSLNRWVVNSAAPGNSLARSGLSVATVL
jgi:hypothetical protein